MLIVQLCAVQGSYTFYWHRQRGALTADGYPETELPICSVVIRMTCRRVGCTITGSRLPPPHTVAPMLPPLALKSALDREYPASLGAMDGILYLSSNCSPTDFWAS